MRFKLARPSVQELDPLLSHLRRLAVTYPQVGATRKDELPIGYRHDRYGVPVGSGETGSGPWAARWRGRSRHVTTAYLEGVRRFVAADR
jgi:hypothetical protein